MEEFFSLNKDTYAHMALLALLELLALMELLAVLRVSIARTAVIQSHARKK